MTENPPVNEEDLDDPVTLVAAVSGLSRNVRKLAARVQGNRRLSIATACGLVLDIALTIVTLFVIHAVLHQNDVQNCINGQNEARAQSTAAFFVAELEKLNGQSDGLRRIAHGQRAGFDEFTKATDKDRQFVNARLHDLGVKFDPNGGPVVDKHGDPVIANPPPSCG